MATPTVRLPGQLSRRWLPLTSVPDRAARGRPSQRPGARPDAGPFRQHLKRHFMKLDLWPPYSGRVDAARATRRWATW